MMTRLNLSGMRYKTMALSAVFVFLAVSLTVVIVNWQLSDKLVQNERGKVAQAAQVSAIQLASVLEAMRRDVLVLANMPPVPGLIRSNANGGIDPLDGSSTTIWQARLAEIFVQVLRNRSEYSQIRLIGVQDNGREIVRVERNGESIAKITGARLQAKGNRPYFQEAVELSPGQVRLSEVNLNRENGQVQVPNSPVVRVMTPAYTPAGGVFGIVVLNVDMPAILNSLRLQAGANTAFYVANGRGDFLVHPEREKAFAFEFGGSFGLGDEFPRFEQVFTSSDVGAADGVLNNRRDRKLVLGVRDVILNSNQPERYLRLVHAVPYDVVVAAATVSHAQLGQFAAVIVLMTVPFALLLGSSLIKPLSRITRLIASYAPGRILKDLPVHRRDEIGTLAQSFAKLIQDVEERRFALQLEVAERSRAEADSKASEIRYLASIELMRDAHIISDDNGVIQSINGAGEQIFGYARTELIGQNVNMLLPECDRGAHDSHWARYRQTGTARVIGKGRDTGLYGQRKDGSVIAVSLMIEKLETAEGLFFTAIIRDISAQLEVEANNRRLTAVVEQATDCILVMTADRVIEYVNPQFEREYGYCAEEVVGKSPQDIGWARSGDQAYAALHEAMQNGEVWSGDLQSKARGGALMEHNVVCSPIKDETGNITQYVQIRRNISARLQLERQLVQAQKLESIGQLAAGIAHEINTPTQYVGDNTRFVKDAFDDIGVLLDTLTELQASADNSVSAQALGEALKRADVEYLREEVPRALAQSLEGVERVTKIVQAMKEFSHPAQDKAQVDLNAAIRSTATVASNEWKYVAELNTDFDLALPQVICLPGEFNQVILNIIVNAAHAIIDVLGAEPEEKGIITITTRKLDDWAEICIRDTGAGMPEDVKARVFDPFFTTKEVGKGTGQGLSIAHNVVVEKHGGTIEVDSTPGQGTCFTIRLPLEDSPPEPVTAAA